MTPIAISTAKRIREELGATHLVIFAVAADGMQHVATHGDTQQHANEAAKGGNRLKKALGWPEDLCRAVPLPRRCGNCVFWKSDGSPRLTGWCRLEPEHAEVTIDNLCRHFEPNV